MPHQKDCAGDGEDNDLCPHIGIIGFNTRLALGNAIKHAAATGINVFQTNIVSLAEAAAADQHAYIEWQNCVNKKKLKTFLLVLDLLEKFINTINLPIAGAPWAPCHEDPSC